MCLIVQCPIGISGQVAHCQAARRSPERYYGWWLPVLALVYIIRTSANGERNSAVEMGSPARAGGRHCGVGKGQELWSQIKWQSDVDSSCITLAMVLNPTEPWFP